MIALICFVLAVLASPFKSKSRLEAENVVLRRQLIVLRRKVRGRGQLTNNDRWFLVQMYRWFPSILTVVTIVQPETLVRWHRAGFRRYWRWKSQIEMELRALIRQMSTENQLWGAPRIHGELLKLGFSVITSGFEFSVHTVVAARAFIAARHYGSTPQEIRRCRQDVLAAGARCWRMSRSIRTSSARASAATSSSTSRSIGTCCRRSRLSSPRTTCTSSVS